MGDVPTPHSKIPGLRGTLVCETQQVIPFGRPEFAFFANLSEFRIGGVWCAMGNQCRARLYVWMFEVFLALGTIFRRLGCSSEQWLPTQVLNTVTLSNRDPSYLILSLFSSCHSLSP